MKTVDYLGEYGFEAMAFVASDVENGSFAADLLSDQLVLDQRVDALIHQLRVRRAKID